MSAPDAPAAPWTLPPVVPVDLVGSAGHTRLTTQVAGWVVDALRKYALGDRITWDVSFQILPVPQGMKPMVLVYLHTPSAVLGELCGEVVLIEPQSVGFQNVENNVQAAVERLRNARSESATRPGPRRA